MSKTLGSYIVSLLTYDKIDIWYDLQGMILKIFTLKQGLDNIYQMPASNSTQI